MTWQIRPFADEDVEPVTAMLGANSPENPLTPDEFRESAERNVQRGPVFRYVVVDDAGTQLGYGNTSRYMMNPKPENFQAFVLVKPAARRQGIGTAIYRALQRDIRSAGGTEVYGMVKETAPESLAWTRGVGMIGHGRSFASMLDLTAWDPTPFLPTVAQAEAASLRLTNLAELGDGDAVMRRLYELDLQFVADEPTTPGGGVAMPFEQWVSFMFSGTRYVQAGVWVALDGERIVANCNLHKHGEGGLINNGTVVDRAYRGRGLALAIKVASLRWAKAEGYRYARTNNHEANAPMLAVNRKLGYTPEPGSWHVMQQL